MSLMASSFPAGPERRRPCFKDSLGILVDDLDEVERRRRDAQQEATWDGNFPAYRRAHAHDPFGNRLEFLQAG